ncbi:MAG: amidase [Deltaproteobacteria bacterium]|nr:amidase [Deltaproteobacteria bacterium]MBW2084492.1 amidase [Deltaproteobacteria bacterium]
MSSHDEFAFLDATAQAELVRSKEVQPIELVEAAIERIERLNPSLNAVITPMYDLAREAAKGEIPDGPFTGVPFLMKDIGAYYAGVRMAMGTALLRDFVPDHDSELTIRQKKAGLISLGKTNTPELGLLPTTEPHLFGPSRNPWNTERTTGGSSGGSSAAVASGLVPMAHANDGGGSIRIPASCCGVFGLKPNRARNSLAPDFGDMFSGLVIEHAVTRSVRDSAALLDATSGPVVGDPYWAPPPARPFLEEVGVDPGRLRIAFTTAAVTGTPVHADCLAAVRDAAVLCEELGHEVVEAAPATPGGEEMFAQAFTVLWAGGLASTINGIALLTNQTPQPDNYEPLTWALYEQGRQFSASDYLLSIQMLQRVARDIAKFFVDYNILLTPVLGEPPVPIGTFDAPEENPMQAWERVVQFAPFTATFNATGQPAMSVPLFWNEEGLPVGAHFVGRFGDEATLFRLAAQLEQARPWADRRPPVSV